MEPKKRKGPQPFSLLVACALGVALLIFWIEKNPDDTGLLSEMSLPFIIGGIVLLVMAVVIGVAFYYHRKKQKNDFEDMGR